MSEHIYTEGAAFRPNNPAMFGVCMLTRGEEVIRCRDCEKFETVDCAVYRALRADSRIDSKGMFNPNGFCAWAERRQA